MQHIVMEDKMHLQMLQESSPLTKETFIITLQKF